MELRNGEKKNNTSYLSKQAGTDLLYTFISRLLEETMKNFYCYAVQMLPFI